MAPLIPNVGVSGQFHALAALNPGKQLSVPTELEFGAFHRPYRRFGEKERSNFLALAKNLPTIPLFPARRLVRLRRLPSM
jgi:hypothetical protein